MSIGPIQKEARAARGDMTQAELGRMLCLSRSMVAEIERGAKRMPRDVAPAAVHTLDSGFYAMELASELTGGAWAGKLDGDCVDLHRSSVRAKTEEELQEALEAIRGVCLVNIPAAMREEDRERLKHLLIQAIDATVALLHLIAVICRDYGFSWVQIWKEWRKKAKQLGYMK